MKPDTQQLSQKYRALLLENSKLCRLDAIRQYIDKHFDSELDISELARNSCMSRAYFFREFKRCYNVTPYQYIVSCRLVAAEYLLLNSDLPITSITYAVGFPSRSSFFRLFKKSFDVSPREYRENSARKATVSHS